MKGTLQSLVLLSGLVLLGPANPQTKPGNAWNAGTYKGLQTGISTEQQVVTRLGKPKLKTVPEGPNDPKLAKWHYERRETEGVCCDLLFRGGVLLEITIDLGGISQARASQIVGGTLSKVRFSSNNTRIEGGSAPLCEDPSGDTMLLVDPKRGVYLWVEPDGSVSSVTFSATRPGAANCRKNRKGQTR